MKFYFYFSKNQRQIWNRKYRLYFSLDFNLDLSQKNTRIKFNTPDFIPELKFKKKNIIFLNFQRRCE